MIFLYNCYGGTHSSSLASAIHLGDLPADRIPLKEEILRTAYFDTLKYKDMGRIIYRGIDRWGNKVYTMGRGTSKVIIPAFEHLIDLMKTECGLSEEIVLVNSSPIVPPLMTMGGFLSRGLHLRFLGRPLLALGAQHRYYFAVEFVRTVLKNHGFDL